MNETWHDVVAAGKDIELMQQARERMVERVRQTDGRREETRILKCGLCRERQSFQVTGSDDPGMDMLNMVEDAGWAEFPDRHGKYQRVCPDCRQRMNER